MSIENSTSLGELPTIPLEETEEMIRNAPTLILGEEETPNDPEASQETHVQILHNWKHLILDEDSPDSKPDIPKSPLPAQSAASPPEKEQGGNVGDEGA